MYKLAIVLLAAVSPALMFAADGQILINQATVMSAGGFPYVINQPGSYKLSGNLAVPSGSDGIHIAVSNVTLDLNGFSITTPVQAETIVKGIWGESASGIPVPVASVTIRNGNIRGFVYPIWLGQAGGSGWVLQDLFLSWDLRTGSSSFLLDSYSRIEHVNAPDFGLGVTFPSIIAFSTARSVNCNALYNSSQPSFNCTFTGNSTMF